MIVPKYDQSHSSDAKGFVLFLLRISSSLLQPMVSHCVCHFLWCLVINWWVPVACCSSARSIYLWCQWLNRGTLRPLHTWYITSSIHHCCIQVVLGYGLLVLYKKGLWV